MKIMLNLILGLVFACIALMIIGIAGVSMAGRIGKDETRGRKR